MKQFYLAFLISLTMLPAVAQDKFRILGEPEPGSKMRPIEVESPIPFDKRYTELSATQKNLFRAQYGVLKASEHPPFPKQGMEAIYKPIIKGHQRVARGGTLFLVAMIDVTGKVENVAVYESPVESITELATAVLFNTDFDPATCDGKPCKMEFPFEFQMRTKERMNAN